MGSLRSNSVKMMAALVVVVSMVGLDAFGGERKFGYVYEVTTLPLGVVEYEQWVTWKTSKKDDSDYDRIDVRHEIEFALTEKLQVGLYLANWRYRDGESVSDDKAEYRSSSVEFKYNLSDPVTDAIGSALYMEFTLGEEVFEIEGKVLLQKNIGKWVFAYNVILEAEWEHKDYVDDKGEFSQTFGISYEITPRWLVGLEALHEVEFDDWEETGHNVVYVGPNVSYRTKDSWWITVTPLFQVTDFDGEADFQTRFLFGFNF